MRNFLKVALIGFAASSQFIYAADFQTLKTEEGFEYGYQQGEKGKPLLIVITTDVAESLSDKYSASSATIRKAGYSVAAIDSTCHGKDTNASEPNGLACWNSRANDSAQNIFASYIERLRSVIKAIGKNGNTDVESVSILGVSRGGYLALKAAEEIDEVKYIIALAPVTDIFRLSEFSKSSASRQLYSLEPGYATLSKKNIFLQINNNDPRVGTEDALKLVSGIASATSGNSNLTAIVTPAKGHSTSYHQTAAQWLIAGGKIGTDSLTPP